MGARKLDSRLVDTPRSELPTATDEKGWAEKRSSWLAAKRDASLSKRTSVAAAVVLTSEEGLLSAPELVKEVAFTESTDPDREVWDEKGGLVKKSAEETHAERVAKALKEAEQNYEETKELISKAVSQQAERHMEMSLARRAMEESAQEGAQIRASSKSRLRPCDSMVPGKLVSRGEPAPGQGKLLKVTGQAGSAGREPAGVGADMGRKPRAGNVRANAPSKMRLCQGYRGECEHQGDAEGCGQCVRQRMFGVSDGSLCNAGSPEGGASSQSSSAHQGVQHLSGSSPGNRDTDTSGDYGLAPGGSPPAVINPIPMGYMVERGARVPRYATNPYLRVAPDLGVIPSSLPVAGEVTVPTAGSQYQPGSPSYVAGGGMVHMGLGSSSTPTFGGSPPTSTPMPSTGAPSPPSAPSGHGEGTRPAATPSVEIPVGGDNGEEYCCGCGELATAAGPPYECMEEVEGGICGHKVCQQCYINLAHDGKGPDRCECHDDDPFGERSWWRDSWETRWDKLNRSCLDGAVKPFSGQRRQDGRGCWFVGQECRALITSSINDENNANSRIPEGK